MTSRKHRKARHSNRKRLVGKSMAKFVKVRTLSNKWHKVTFIVKPAFRARIQKMVGTGKRSLHVKQVIRSKRIGKQKNRSLTRVFHSYKVRAG